MKISLRNAGLGLIAALVVVSLGSEAAMLWSRQVVQTRVAAETAEDARVREIVLPLVTALKDMELDTVQVQQFLSDISATRGQDGLDDGFKEAEKNAREFDAHSGEAKRLAKAIGDEDMVKALEDLQGLFPDYYALGKTMAQAYIDEGPAGGNKMMPQFDKLADHLAEGLEKIGKRRESLVSEAGEQSGRLVEALNAAMDRAAWVALAATLVTLAFLLAAALGLQKLFIAPVGELTDLLERLAGGDDDVVTTLTAWRNEIGRMARTAEVFVANARARRSLEGEAVAERQREIVRQKKLEQLIADFRGVIGEVVGAVDAETAKMGETAHILNRVAAKAEQTAGSARQATQELVAQYWRGVRGFRSSRRFGRTP